MPHSLRFPLPSSLDTLSDSERQQLAQAATTLMRQALAGRPASPLRGRNIGLVCEDVHSEDAARFERAASALGAQVVHIRPSVAGLDDGPALPQTARVLGRLYDAIECQGLASGTVARIRQHAGVPVFDGLADAASTLRAIATLMGEEAAGTPERDSYVLQALLANSVG